MRRAIPFFLLATLILLVSCTKVGRISSDDVAGTPTAYAKVINAPDPTLLGFWRRLQPAGINNPWEFSYWLVKKGDKYAVYYFYDSHKQNAFKGWAEFTIDGHRMVSGLDKNAFFVEGYDVYMTIPGRDERYRMVKMGE